MRDIHKIPDSVDFILNGMQHEMTILIQA